MDGAESSSESESEQDESEEETQKTVIAFMCFMNQVLRNIKFRLNAVLPLWSLCVNKKSNITLVRRAVAIETTSSDLLTLRHASLTREQETHQ